MNPALVATCAVLFLASLVGVAFFMGFLIDRFEARFPRLHGYAGIACVVLIIWLFAYMIAAGHTQQVQLLEGGR